MRADFVTNLVSVVLCARNAQGTIEKAVVSILGQSHQHLELFIVDDGSSDNTADVVERKVHDSRVTLLRLKSNVGTYAAKNFAIRNFVHGEFVALQDADDFSWPKRLAEQIDFIRGRDVAACGTGIDEFFDDPSIEPRFSVGLPAHRESSDDYLHKTNLYPEKISWQDVCDPTIPVQNLKIAMNGSLMFRSEVLRTLGGFDGRMPVGGDTDLLLRLIALHDFGNVQSVLYSRAFYRGSLTASPSTNFNSPVRQRVIQSIELKRKKLRESLAKGDHDSSREITRSDMFCPDVAFNRKTLSVDVPTKDSSRH